MLNEKTKEFFKYLSKKFHINYTTEQQKALLHTKGNMLLLSAPGSGKTTVVVGRIGNLILNNNVDPKSIMALTFSKASAIDMEDRFNKLFGDVVKERPRFSTIHSFSMTVLKEYAQKKSIQFRLIEDEGNVINKHSIIRECYKRVNSSFLPEDKLEEILSTIGYVKNMMLKEEEIKHLKVGVKGFVDIYSEYESIKRKYKYIDYDDMLTFALSILKLDESILNKYREKYRYIICDEAQDSSKVQHAILWLLGNNRDNVFFVADDDQSIYGFRGSYLNGLKRFNTLYENSNILYMERNFRSSENIVSLTNEFIKSNRERYDKNIYTENDSGEDVEVVSLNNDTEELSYIIEEIKNSKDKSIGILYRNNLVAIPIVNKLEMLDIPFYIRDNNKGFFKHWILDDIKAFFTLSSDESNINALEKIYFKTDSYISRNMIDYLRGNYNPDESVFDQLLRCPFIETYNEKSIKIFRSSLKAIKDKSPYYAIDYIENNMKYLEYLNRSINEMENSKNNLKDIIGVLKAISKDLTTIEELFDRIEGIKSKIYVSKLNKSKSNVTLTTIHSAKGLEYDKVYMVDLIEGIIPGFESIEEERKGEIALMEEERRLFYVAMTRARHSLKILSIREKNSKKVYPSRFINEVYKILYKGNEVVDSLLEPISYNVNIGDVVVHKAFGKGVIRNIEGDAVEINFLKLGSKKLLLDVCLEKGLLSIQ